MAVTGKTIGLEDLTTSDPALWEITTAGAGPQGQLPLTAEMLRERPSGDLFGLTQNAGMGWEPRELGRPQFLILSTQGGIRAPDGRRSRSAITPATGKSACSCRRRPRSSRRSGACRSPPIAPTRATAARRARPG